mmetsp:Transcript_12910/g.28640  ORF Transcript_12910/g.28640 Transcript_12910/m.28640 type:complete len:218 (-) Transcript_12910:182-835(-)
MAQPEKSKVTELSFCNGASELPRVAILFSEHLLKLRLTAAKFPSLPMSSLMFSKALSVKLLHPAQLRLSAVRERSLPKPPAKSAASESVNPVQHSKARTKDPRRGSPKHGTKTATDSKEQRPKFKCSADKPNSFERPIPKPPTAASDKCGQFSKLSLTDVSFVKWPICAAKLMSTRHEEKSKSTSSSLWSLHSADPSRSAPSGDKLPPVAPLSLTKR